MSVKFRRRVSAQIPPRVARFQLKMLKKSNLNLLEPPLVAMPTVCNDLFDTVTEQTPLEEGNRALLSHLPIFAFIATTDAGPDQVAAKDIIAKEISPVLCLLFISVNCHEHQAHLIAKGNSKMMQTACHVVLRSRG